MQRHYKNGVNASSKFEQMCQKCDYRYFHAQNTNQMGKNSRLSYKETFKWYIALNKVQYLSLVLAVDQMSFTESLSQQHTQNCTDTPLLF